MMPHLRFVMRGPDPRIHPARTNLRKPHALMPVAVPSPLVGEGIAEHRPALTPVRGNVSTIAKAPSPALRLTPRGPLSHKGRGKRAACAGVMSATEPKQGTGQ